MKKLILVILTIKCAQGLDPLVQTRHGLIRGVQSETGDYAMFLGVPYAVVEENNPFGAATPHPGFNHTFEAYHDDVICPQYYGTASGMIHCLQANIYVPDTANSRNTLPVMIYLHGGKFLMGHKSQLNLQPTFLIKHEVIIVTLNYRLGPYGFLCVSEPGYSNQGLKDQLLGIQWVKDNIAAFGGDVNRITGFGQSAGAMTLDIQLLATEGLLNRAIIQSGSALTTWVVATQNDSIPINIAGRLGFETTNVKDAMTFLSSKDPLEVMTAANYIMKFDNGHPLTKPCVETWRGDAILKDFPMNLQPKVKGMDIIIGHTNKEAMFMYGDNSDNDFYRNYDFKEELLMAFDGAYDVDVVKHFYVGDKVLNEDLQSKILDYGSDIAFNYPAERSVQRYLEAGAKSVYRYVFSYEGERNGARNARNFTSGGACHGDDMAYLFDMSVYKDVTPNEEDQRVIDALTTMWTNFAKYGEPTPSITMATPVKWPAATMTRRPYLNIDKPISVQSSVFHERMAFWELYYKLHADKLKGVIMCPIAVK